MNRATTRLRRRAEAFCSRNATTRIFDPLLADMEHELSEVSGWRRVARQLRWEGAFFWSLLRVTIPEWIRRDDGAGVRTLGTAIVARMLINSALVSFPLYNMAASGWAVRFGALEWVRAVLYLIPQAVVGLPGGIIAAALFNSKRHLPAARQTLVTVIALTFVATVALLWLLPSSNQAFRTLISPRPLPPPPGMRETGLFDLARQMFPGGVGPFSSSRQIALAFHSRLAVLVGPLAFGALALALSRWVRRSTIVPVGGSIGVGFLVLFVWPAALAMGEAGIMPAALAPWVPNTVALVVAGVLRASVNRPAAGAVV